MHDDQLNLLPNADVSRRGFVVTSLAAGFALAAQPVSAQTISTDTNGLEAGDVKIPVTDGESPLIGHCRRERGRSRSSWWCRRSSASTSTSRTSAGGLPSSATSPSRRSSTRDRETSRISRKSLRSSPRSSPRCPTPR